MESILQIIDEVLSKNPSLIALVSKNDVRQMLISHNPNSFIPALIQNPQDEKRFQETFVCFKVFCILQPDPQVYLHLGVVLELWGKYGIALQIYRHAHKIYPKSQVIAKAKIIGNFYCHWQCNDSLKVVYNIYLSFDF